MKELLEIVVCMEVMEESYRRIKALSTEGFQMFVGGLIDQYAADHGFTDEETFNILTELSAVQKEVHRQLGPATTTVA